MNKGRKPSQEKAHKDTVRTEVYHYKQTSSTVSLCSTKLLAKPLTFFPSVCSFHSSLFNEVTFRLNLFWCAIQTAALCCRLPLPATTKPWLQHLPCSLHGTLIDPTILWAADDSGWAFRHVSSRILPWNRIDPAGTQSQIYTKEQLRTASLRGKIHFLHYYYFIIFNRVSFSSLASVAKPSS